MVQPVCTGYGASDTHAYTLSTGEPNRHPSAGIPYAVISGQDIFNLAMNPPVSAKDQAQWIIPSSYCQYDARSHEVQKEKGCYWWLAADIDRGNPVLHQLTAAVSEIMNCWHLIYSTSSATSYDKKWRVLIPLSDPIDGIKYSAFQASLFDGLEHKGIYCDRSLERTGQLIYLPNRGSFYEAQAFGQGTIDPYIHPITFRVKQYLDLAQAAKEGIRRTSGKRSYIGAFRRKHDTVTLLEAYGFVQEPTGKWRVPGQSSQGSLIVHEDGSWHTFSQTAAELGIGKPAHSGTYGDAYDLYLHFQCKDDAKLAEAYGRQCLEEEDNSPESQYHKEFGRLAWEGLYIIGDKLGPAGLRQLAVESQSRILNVEDDEPPASHEWDIHYPPGLAGQIAEYIHKSSIVPVKQYAIAYALFLLSSLAGSRYNAAGKALNVYFMIIGESGRGKGAAASGFYRLIKRLGDATHDQVNLNKLFGNKMPASGQAIDTMFTDQKTVAVVQPDATHFLQTVINTSINSSNSVAMREGFTTYYDHSGKDDLPQTKGYSNSQNNKKMVEGPCYVVIADVQFTPFKEYLGAWHGLGVGTGFAQRWVYVMRNHDDKSKFNRNHSEQPDKGLIDNLAALWNSIRMRSLDPASVTDVRVLDSVHEKMLDFAEAHQVEVGETDYRNRQHMNALRMAATVAVGINHVQPVVTDELYDWALQFAEFGFKRIEKIVSKGEAGSGHRVRLSRLREVISGYAKLSTASRHKAYNVPKSVAEFGDVLPENFLVKRMSSMKDFEGHDQGRTSEQHARETLAEAVRQGILVEMTAQEVGMAKSVLIDARVKKVFYMLGEGF